MSAAFTQTGQHEPCKGECCPVWVILHAHASVMDCNWYKTYSKHQKTHHRELSAVHKIGGDISQLFGAHLVK